jgi:hypothetical protein
MEVLLTFIGAVGLVALVVLYGSFSWGFVSYTFYNWFVLTSLTQLPKISVYEFIGFAIFLNSLIRGGQTYIKDEYKDKGTEYTMLFLSPWFVLFFGWFIKLLIL